MPLVMFGSILWLIAQLRAPLALAWVTKAGIRSSTEDAHRDNGTGGVSDGDRREEVRLYRHRCRPCTIVIDPADAGGFIETFPALPGAVREGGSLGGEPSLIRPCEVIGRPWPRAAGRRQPETQSRVI